MPITFHLSQHTHPQALAASQAVSAADAAVAAGLNFLVMEISVGTDAKAVGEAWNAITAKHAAKLCALLLSRDAEKGKVGQMCEGQGWQVQADEHSLLIICMFYVCALTIPSGLSGLESWMQAGGCHAGTST